MSKSITQDMAYLQSLGYQRRRIKVERVQTDNGFKFTKRFSNSKRDLSTMFELAAQRLNTQHRLIPLFIYFLTFAKKNFPYGRILVNFPVEREKLCYNTEKRGREEAP